MSEQTILYVGAVEDLYVSVAGFIVDGQPADPTLYAASLALATSGQDVDEWTWAQAEWVADTLPPQAKALYGEVEPLVAGAYWLYLKLEGTRERLICQAGRVRVKTVP